MSKDATIEIISEVKAHPGADRLDLVKILGFQCVTQKGLYKNGDKIVYIRPDSLLPEEDWAIEYRKYSPSRIKAVRLRHEWSEGIIVPFNILPVDLSDKEVGEDVSSLINVVHWDPPVPQDLSAKGLLPYGIGKTDEERFENLIDELPFGETVDITLKVDGQSCSYYYNYETKEFGVLGRNLEFKSDAVNNYTSHVKTYDIENKLREFCEKEKISLCLRGESYGQGIQGMKINPHSQLPKGWAMFSVYITSERRYARKGDKYYFLEIAKELNLPTVDIVEKDVVLTKDTLTHYSTGIKKLNDKYFEGVVIQHPKGSFKVINKHYDSEK